MRKLTPDGVMANTMSENRIMHNTRYGRKWEKNETEHVKGGCDRKGREVCEDVDAGICHDEVGGTLQ